MSRSKFGSSSTFFDDLEVLFPSMNVLLSSSAAGRGDDDDVTSMWSLAVGRGDDDDATSTCSLVAGRGDGDDAISIDGSSDHLDFTTLMDWLEHMVFHHGVLNNDSH